MVSVSEVSGGHKLLFQVREVYFRCKHHSLTSDESGHDKGIESFRSESEGNYMSVGCENSGTLFCTFFMLP